jgi:hypothetical protein
MYAPYGSYSVDPTFRSRYGERSGLEQQVPLTDSLPYHHPALERLTGRTPICDAPGPWWSDMLETVPEDLQELLRDISPEEYRAGVVADHRWRAFKRHHAHLSHRGPSIGGLLDFSSNTSPNAALWETLWQERGSKDTPLEMDLVISTQPECFLNMSNGSGWSSCMGLCSSGSSRSLPGNFYDPGVAIAMLLPRGASIWDKKVIIARTTLRHQHFQEQGGDVIALGRCYHNNRTAAQNLILSLISLLETQGLVWGFIMSTSSHDLWTQGHLGAERQHIQLTSSVTYGDAFYLPRPDCLQPFVDGACSWQDTYRDEETWYTLRATVAHLPLFHNILAH